MCPAIASIEELLQIVGRIGVSGSTITVSLHYRALLVHAAEIGRKRWKALGAWPSHGQRCNRDRPMLGAVQSVSSSGHRLPGGTLDESLSSRETKRTECTLAPHAVYSNLQTRRPLPQGSLPPNPAEVQALRVVQEHPRGWVTRYLAHP